MRKLNQIRIVGDAECLHCDEPIKPPYERVPEAETANMRVIRCQHCGNMNVFIEAETDG